MVRFNGGIRARTRAARGLERIDSAPPRGLRVFHNVIRPHGGRGTITPAQAAGIVVERPNAAMTLAQNAAVHRLRRRPQGRAHNRQGAVQDNPRRRAPKAPGGAPAPPGLLVRPTMRPESAAGAARPARGAAGSGNLTGGRRGTVGPPAADYKEPCNLQQLYNNLDKRGRCPRQSQPVPWR